MEGFTQIYTDGSYRAKTKKGAYGAIIYSPNGEISKISGIELDTTNNIMEMKAVLISLELIRAKALDPKRTVIFSDSQYVVRGLNEWYRGWVLNGFRTAGGEPIKNRDLWVELATAWNAAKCEIFWVKGHDKNDRNNEIDDLVQSLTE